MDQETQLQLQQMTAQLQQLQTYMQMLEEQTQETANAIESMEALEQVKPGTKAYVPLTNGIYVKATLEQTDEFLINTGHNTTTAQSPQEAKKLLKLQQEELAEAQGNMMDQFTQLYQQYMELQLKMQEGQ